jgi:glycosyltransferase involved in cell wall biosynthesis
MRIGFLSTRLAGTDGVSLETAKLAKICRDLGHETFFCAGELDPDLTGHLAPLMHFTHPDIQAIQAQCFGTSEAAPGLLERIQRLADGLKVEVARFVDNFAIDRLVIQNAHAIPMNVPLGLALADFVEERAFPTLAHHHDFYWERERFTVNCIQPLLDRAFPAVLPTIRHMVINSPAQASLRQRTGADSVVIPNIFDFAQAAPGITPANRDLRQRLGLTDEDLLILQPTRVIPRKGIELSIDFMARIQQPQFAAQRLGKNPVLVISHHAGDEGMDYLRRLQAQAEEQGVRLIYAAHLFAAQPGPDQYSLWDAYIHADFVTYPSLYEGFGNALLETLYFRLPALVNHYAVYTADIHPLGFDLVEIHGAITEQSVTDSLAAMMDPVRRRRMTEHNYQLAREHYAYESVAPILAEVIG